MARRPTVLERAGATIKLRFFDRHDRQQCFGGCSIPIPPPDVAGKHESVWVEVSIETPTKELASRMYNLSSMLDEYDPLETLLVRARRALRMKT